MIPTVSKFAHLNKFYKNGLFDGEGYIKDIFGKRYINELKALARIDNYIKGSSAIDQLYYELEKTKSTQDF